MTTRIEKDFYFQAAVRFENKFYLNIYDLTLSMLVETESTREQNVAIERINYFLNTVLENCVFVYYTETEAIELYEKAGLKVCSTPEEPYDQIISLILILKLNAILENKLFITDMIMGSKLSDGIKFSVVPEVASNMYKEPGWYNDSSTCIRHQNKISKRKEKIVKLFDADDWNDLGLSWKEKPKTSKKVQILDTDK